MPIRIRLVSALAAAALASLLTACGSGGTGDAGNSGGAGAKECSGRIEEGGVKDDGFGGTVAVDPCAVPRTEKTTLGVAWVSVSDVPRETASPLNINPVSCDGEATADCEQVEVKDDFARCNQAKPGCHPARGEELSVVCVADDVDKGQGVTTRWYGVLLDSRLLALGTDHDGNFVRHSTDKGDKPVGYVPTTAVAEVTGDLPACDGSVLNAKGSLDIAKAGGGAIR
ncbi:hypothetical protein ACFQ8C_30385 [Streptomyces sp. NPDC056503]|uniref:hypothetical protein n=1 Tax=Streptomyces sp. NPDC056503 TaxID=3345842 RepID=UPI0036CDA66A